MPPRKGQKSLTVGPMSRVKYQTSVPLLWLLGIDLLTWLAFIISVIVLFAGISTTNLQDVAILTVRCREAPNSQSDGVADSKSA